MTSIYEQDLSKTPANFAALSPVSFLERSADIYPDLPAVIHGRRHYTWAQVRERSARLAAALQASGIQRGATVSVMLSNTPRNAGSALRRACGERGVARPQHATERCIDRLAN